MGVKHSLYKFHLRVLSVASCLQKKLLRLFGSHSPYSHSVSGIGDLVNVRTQRRLKLPAPLNLGNAFQAKTSSHSRARTLFSWSHQNASPLHCLVRKVYLKNHGSSVLSRSSHRLKLG